MRLAEMLITFFALEQGHVDTTLSMMHEMNGIK